MNLANNSFGENKMDLNNEQLNLKSIKSIKSTSDNQSESSKSGCCNSTISLTEEEKIEKSLESKCGIALWLLNTSGTISMIYSILVGSEIIVIAFNRSQPFPIIEAVSSIAIIYEIFCVNIPATLTYYYDEEAFKLLKQENLNELGMLTKKMITTLILFSLFTVIIFTTCIYPFYNAILTNQDASKNLREMILYMSIGIPFWFYGYGITKYLLVLNIKTPLIISYLSGLILMLGYMFIIIFWLDKVNIGVGTCFIIGFVVSFLFQYFYLVIYSPQPEINKMILNPFYNISNFFNKDYWIYIKNTFFCGILVAMNTFSISFLSFFGLIIGDKEFTTINFLIIIISTVAVFSESLAIQLKVLLEYVIKDKRYSKAKEIVIVAFIINTIYLAIILTVGLLLFYYIMWITVALNYIIELGYNNKFYLLFVLLFNNQNSLLLESLNVFCAKEVGFFSVLIGRVIMNFSLILILTLNGYAMGGIFLSFSVGQLCTILFMGSYIIFLFINDMRGLKQSISSLNLNLEIKIFENSDIEERRILSNRSKKSQNKLSQNLQLVISKNE